jgi:hypothetical protein
MYYYWNIGIVNTNEAAKQEIIDLLSTDCILAFTDCTYSHSQRVAIRDEISTMDNTKILDVFLMRDETIWVIVLEDSASYYKETLFTQYGDMIFVISDESLPSEAVGDALGDSLLATQMPIKQVNWITPAILVLLFGAIAALYFNRARFVPAMQTNNGNVVTGNVHISRKQTIAAIKNSTLTPSDDVFKSIMERVDKQIPKD